MKNYQLAFIKTLTASDIDPKISNQHELHGVKKLERIFGIITSDKKIQVPATIKLGYSGTEYLINITWYNARAKSNNRHEYRLYYDSTSNTIMSTLQSGDDIFIGKTMDNHIEIIIFKQTNRGFNDWTPLDHTQTIAME